MTWYRPTSTRLLIVAYIGAILIGSVLLWATMTGRAGATTDRYVTVAWELPDGHVDPPTDNHPSIWPQSLHAWVPTHTLDLDALDQVLAAGCGATYQVDVYRYKTPEDRAAVDALIATGVLDSPGGHPQDSGLHPSPSGSGITWKFVAAPDCVPDPEPEPIVEVVEVSGLDCDTLTITTTVSTTTTGWVLDGLTWIPAEPVVTVESSTVPAPVEDCPEVCPDGGCPIECPTGDGHTVGVDPSYGECPDLIIPTPEPDPEVTPEPEPEVEEEPTVEEPEILPVTGVETWQLATVGIVLATLGACLAIAEAYDRRT